MTKEKKTLNKATTRAELRWDYEKYLRRHRGLTETTILRNWQCTDRFLKFRFGNGPIKLWQIKQSDIVDFLQHLTAGKADFREKNPSTFLRNFFRYLFKDGKSEKNLALGIPSVAQRYGARLPRHLTPEQVETLLEAVHTDGSVGRRDYAMVLLLARLGLRAPEVVAMQLDDVDWRAGEIIVRGKGNRHDRLPLPPDAGKAIADYIKFERVSSSRTLFVTARPPHRPFRDGQRQSGRPAIPQRRIQQTRLIASMP